MANVFISYERSTEAIARNATRLLQERGHETWSDDLIPPHRDYADVIQEHLDAADVVLVLWSHGAAQSQWVRAEADHAREHGKLVQAVLDSTVPPMPFNRIQCAKLAGWNGEPNNAEWAKVLDSVVQVASTDARAPRGTGPTASTSPPATDAPVASARRLGAIGRAGLATVAAAIIVAAAIAWQRIGLFSSAPVHGTRVAVLPFDALSPGEATRYFAAGLADQIATTLSNDHIPVVSRDDAAALRGADREHRAADLGVALVLDGTVQDAAGQVTVRMHLDDPVRHANVWSKELRGDAAGGDQLQARIASIIGGMLSCSNRALYPTNGLTDPALLARYLRACDIFANEDDNNRRPEDSLEMLAALREVTEKAPEFVAAHSDLAKFDAYLAPMWPAEQAAAMRQEAAAEAQRALALDPKTPDAYLAEAILLPIDRWADRERLLREGVAADPRWPHTNGFLAILLADVGRVKEAIAVAQLAGAADLQIEDWSNVSVSLVASSGGPAAPCIELLTRQLAVRPADSGRWGSLLGCQISAGHWDAANAMLTSESAPTAGTPFGATLIAWVTAAKTRAPADVDHARRQLLASASFPLPIIVQDLAYLDLVDDAFAMAQRYDPKVSGGPGFLFVKLATPMRHDPRFMQFTARIGLVDYWQSSGHWPDFCSEPGLPYDCRAEAERANRS